MTKSWASLEGWEPIICFWGRHADLLKESINCFCSKLSKTIFAGSQWISPRKCSCYEWSCPSTGRIFPPPPNNISEAPSHVHMHQDSNVSWLQARRLFLAWFSTLVTAYRSMCESHHRTLDLNSTISWCWIKTCYETRIAMIHHSIMISCPASSVIFWADLLADERDEPLRNWSWSSSVPCHCLRHWSSNASFDSVFGVQKPSFSQGQVVRLATCEKVRLLRDLHVVEL